MQPVLNRLVSKRNGLATFNGYVWRGFESLSMTLYLISYLSYVYFPTCTLKQSENEIKISFGHSWLSSRQEKRKNRENLVLIVWLYWFKSKPYGYTLNRSNSAYTICCIPIHAFLIHFLHDQFAIIYFRLLLNEIQLVFRWKKIHQVSKSAFEFHTKLHFLHFDSASPVFIANPNETNPCEVTLDEW